MSASRTIGPQSLRFTGYVERYCGLERKRKKKDELEYNIIIRGRIIISKMKISKQYYSTIDYSPAFDDDPDPIDKS